MENFCNSYHCNQESMTTISTRGHLEGPLHGGGWVTRYPISPYEF